MIRIVNLCVHGSILMGLLMTTSCAPDVSQTSGGAGGGSTLTTMSTTSGAPGGGGSGGGVWTACTSPEGYRICGGKDHCSSDPNLCGLCDMGGGAVTFCQNDAFQSLPVDPCGTCVDGDICAGKGIYSLCLPFDYGVLYDRAGGGSELHYADLSDWTGDTLPEPTTCPTFADFQVCGGHCGGCPIGQYCTGRSPTHPYGMCFPNDSTDFCIGFAGSCGRGKGCFAFEEPAISRGLYAYCIPKAACTAAAAMLPGGGVCQLP